MIQDEDIKLMAVIAISEAFSDLRPGESIIPALSKAKSLIPQIKLKKEFEEISNSIF